MRPDSNAVCFWVLSGKVCFRMVGSIFVLIWIPLDDANEVANIAVFVDNVPHVKSLFVLIHILLKLPSEAYTPQQSMLRILFGIASRRRLHGCPDSSEMNGLVLPDFNIAGLARLCYFYYIHETCT